MNVVEYDRLERVVEVPHWALLEIRDRRLAAVWDRRLFSGPIGLDAAHYRRLRWLSQCVHGATRSSYFHAVRKSPSLGPGGWTVCVLSDRPRDLRAFQWQRLRPGALGWWSDRRCGSIARRCSFSNDSKVTVFLPFLRARCVTRRWISMCSKRSSASAIFS